MANKVKSDIIACAANILSNESQAAATLNALILLVNEELLAKGIIAIPKLGTFKIIQSNAREEQNSGSGEKMKIPNSNNVLFLPTPDLEQEITDYTL